MTELNNYLITYLEQSDFSKAINESASNPSYQLDPSLFQYVICVAPDYDSILSILERRFSDVEIIGIANKNDYINAIQQLEGQELTSKAYIANTTDSSGNPNWVILLDKDSISDEEIVSEIIVGEYKKTLEEKLTYFSNPDVPTVHYQQ